MPPTTIRARAPFARPLGGALMLTLSLAGCAVGSTLDEEGASGLDASTAVDAGGDDAVAALDATNDATNDDAAVDVGRDASDDATPDVSLDAPSDVSDERDASVVFDATLEATTDTGRDVGVDVGVDVGIDVGIDVGVDVGVDVGIDTGAACGGPCDSVPAAVCENGTQLRVYSGLGACVSGQCQYPSSLSTCTHGCVNGACASCAIDADCGAGHYCTNGVCLVCSNDRHCGGSCTDCTLGGGVCKGGTTCVQCTIDAQCGVGNFCDSGNCAACNTATKCGASCLPCGGSTPDCSGTACVCNATSCGVGAMCTPSGCVTCNTAGACGPTCSACSGTTPSCGGAGVGCQCTTSPDSCGGTSSWCSAGACAACGAGSCGNGRCDCGETTGTCAADCGPPCPVGLKLATWTSGDDGWTYASGNWWVRTSGYMSFGYYAPHSGSYSQDLAYSSNVDLTSCSSATLTFTLSLQDDPGYGSDKAQKLTAYCSGDGGASWVAITPSTWPSNQGACSPSYCGGYNTSRGFGWTGQTDALPAACLKSGARFKFTANGTTTWGLQAEGWRVDDVTVN